MTLLLPEKRALRPSLINNNTIQYSLLTCKELTFSYCQVFDSFVRSSSYALLAIAEMPNNELTSICQVMEYLNIYVPRDMDELPIRQSHSQPVNPSHVTINGLAHYCTHNASVNNSI